MATILARNLKALMKGGSWGRMKPQVIQFRILGQSAINHAGSQLLVKLLLVVPYLHIQALPGLFLSGFRLCRAPEHTILLHKIIHNDKHLRNTTFRLRRHQCRQWQRR